MAFSDVYSNILTPFVESYKAATNQKMRAIVIQNAADAVKKSSHLLKDSGVALPKDLKAVCAFSLCFLDLSVTRYIKGLLANDKEPTVETDPKPKKIKQFYTIRDVIKEL
jgi:hypothetical protein